MPVGNVKSETTVSAGTVRSTRTIAPVPGVGPACGRAHLQRVQLAAAEGEPEHLLDPGRADLERPVAGEPPDVLVARASLGSNTPRFAM